MKTFQEKAEAYVREKLPELMELSFGCEVTILSMIEKQKKGMRVTKSGFSTISIGEEASVFDIEFGNISLRHCDYQIIGHPIQLPHWVKVLHKETGCSITYKTSVNGGGYIQTSCLTAAQVKAKSARIGFDVNDEGQPATEEDYKAFCEIVGVE